MAHQLTRRELLTASAGAAVMTAGCGVQQRSIAPSRVSILKTPAYEQSIYDTFVNEMLYGDDDSIKGDCQVVPRGAAMILIRESAQQRASERRARLTTDRRVQRERP